MPLAKAAFGEDVLIFVPITTFMARIGAKVVHKINKKKVSKYLGVFLLIVAIKFFYEYINLQTGS